ncbi:Hypothetical predicted protein, partial [Pelobates cultripes]
DLQPGALLAKEAVDLRTQVCPAAVKGANEPRYLRCAGGGDPGTPMGGYSDIVGACGKVTRSETPCDDISNMVDAAYIGGTSEEKFDVLPKLDRTFADFWRKMELRLNQPGHLYKNLTTHSPGDLGRP